MYVGERLFTLLEGKYSIHELRQQQTTDKLKNALKGVLPSAILSKKGAFESEINRYMNKHAMDGSRGYCLENQVLMLETNKRR